jgi:chromosome partitioning protein
LRSTSIIAIASQKGGVGKSMLAIHLAAEAARKRKRAVILELDRQGTVSLLWNKRRAEKLKPDDMLKPVDRFNPQPEVRRAESVTLEQTVAELRGAGVELIVLDLPGTHSPAINKAIGIADITLIPTRPRDVDLQPSIETADAARRANKPFAYVFTFVPGTGQHCAQMRDTLEDANLTVAPGGIGDRPKEFADAIENGQTVQERNPNGKSAGEIRTLWKWLEKQLGGLHGRKVD